jgi:hypothetical protein
MSVVAMFSDLIDYRGHLYKVNAIYIATEVDFCLNEQKHFKHCRESSEEKNLYKYIFVVRYLLCLSVQSCPLDNNFLNDLICGVPLPSIQRQLTFYSKLGRSIKSRLFH